MGLATMGPVTDSNNNNVLGLFSNLLEASSSPVHALLLIANRLACTVNDDLISSVLYDFLSN